MCLSSKMKKSFWLRQEGEQKFSLSGPKQTQTHTWNHYLLFIYYICLSARSCVAVGCDVILHMSSSVFTCLCVCVILPGWTEHSNYEWLT